MRPAAGIWVQTIQVHSALECAEIPRPAYRRAPNSPVASAREGGGPAPHPQGGGGRAAPVEARTGVSETAGPRASVWPAVSAGVPAAARAARTAARRLVLRGRPHEQPGGGLLADRLLVPVEPHAELAGRRLGGLD